MKVVLYEPTGSGGIFHYTFELAESLAKSSADVLVLTKDGYELGHLDRQFRIKAQLQASQIKRLFVHLKERLLRKYEGSLGAVTGNRVGDGGSVPRACGNLRRLVLWAELVFTLLMQRPDVVHFQWLDEPGKDYYLLVLLNWLGFKIVYTAHNVIPHDTESLNKTIYRKIYTLVDRVVVHGVSSKEEIVDCFSVAPDKIFVVPHGAYTLFFRNGRLTKEAARGELALPRDGRIILFFGTIREYKGLEYLVDAFRLIRNSLPSAILLVVGDVPSADKKSIARYSKLMAELASEKQVMFRREYVDFHAVGKYFSACDVVVLPYIKTYQSGVLMLACAAGRPAIVTETGGLGEVLDNGKSGIVVSPKSVGELAEATASLITDIGRADDMGGHALGLSRAEYSWNNIARQTLGVYESVIRKSDEQLSLTLGERM